MMSHFPNGFANGLTVRGVPITVAHPGEVFWVGNSATLLTGEATASDGNSGTFLKPFSTVDYAIGRCAAGRGDIIMIRPGHTETVTAASGIDCDVAGAALVGLGNGNSKPTITFSTAASASIAAAAANVTMFNLRFVSGIANLTNTIESSAAHTTISHCEFMASAAATGMNISVITTAASTGLYIGNCVFNMESSIAGVAVTDVPTEAIRLVGCDNAIIEDNYIVGNYSTSAINGITTASEGLLIRRNQIHNVTTSAAAGGVDLVAGCTGMISDNRIGSYEATTIDTIIDSASCSSCFNHLVNVVTEVSDLGGLAST